MALNSFFAPRAYIPDNNGAPLSGGKVYTYEPGTSTNKATYSDLAGTTANDNPVILDSRGEASIYLSGSYKIVVKDAEDVPVYTVDDFTGTTGFPVDDDVAVFNDPTDSTKKVRLDAGSVTAGQTRVLTAPDHDMDLGTVSYRPMQTAASTASYWAKLKTWTVATDASSAISETLQLESVGTSPGSSASITIHAECDATGNLSSANSAVSVNAIIGSVFAYNGFMLVQPSAGTVELYVQAHVASAVIGVYEIAAENDAGVTAVAYNDGATWDAATPSGVVTSTSDYAGAAGVVDWGSNSDGEWVQFADGTVLANATKTVTIPASGKLSTTFNCPTALVVSSPTDFTWQASLAVGDASVHKNYYPLGVDRTSANASTQIITYAENNGTSAVERTGQITVTWFGRWK